MALLLLPPPLPLRCHWRCYGDGYCGDGRYDCDYGDHCHYATNGRRRRKKRKGIKDEEHDDDECGDNLDYESVCNYD